MEDNDSTIRLTDKPDVIVEIDSDNFGCSYSILSSSHIFKLALEKLDLEPEDSSDMRRLDLGQFKLEKSYKNAIAPILAVLHDRLPSPNLSSPEAFAFCRMKRQHKCNTETANFFAFQVLKKVRLEAEDNVLSLFWSMGASWLVFGHGEFQKHTELIGERVTNLDEVVERWCRDGPPAGIQEVAQVVASKYIEGLS